LHKHNEEDEHALPIKRDLTLAYLVWLVIALVMASASIAGLLSGTGIYPGVGAKVLPLFVGQDALNLASSASLCPARRVRSCGVRCFQAALAESVIPAGASFTMEWLPPASMWSGR